MKMYFVVHHIPRYLPLIIHPMNQIFSALFFFQRVCKKYIQVLVLVA